MRLVRPEYATMYGNREEVYRSDDKYSWLEQNEKPADFICGFEAIDGGVFSVFKIEDPNDREFIKRIIAAVKRGGTVAKRWAAAIVIKPDAISSNGLIIVEENGTTRISEIDVLHHNIKNATLSKIASLLDTFPGSIQNYVAFHKVDIEAVIKELL